MLEQVEALVLDYLKKHGSGYTRPMYKSLGIKQLGMSLNGFRNHLRWLHQHRKIKLRRPDKDTPYPIWKSNHDNR